MPAGAGTGAGSGAGSAKAAGAGRDPARRPGPTRAADPRRTAYDVLAAVRDREAYANLLLPKLLAERQLTGRDAAFATELAYGTLRGQGSYDAVIAACSDRPLGKLDPPVLDVLRLGTHQLLSTRVGAHAAVATSVDLARSVSGPRVSGYVNAVLRRVATRDLGAWLDIVAPDPAADPDGALAVRYSHPRWIVGAYRAALGDAAARPFAGAAHGEDEDAAGGELAAGRVVAGENVAGQEAAGENVAGQVVAGQIVAGEGNPAGQAPAAGPPLTELAAALAAGNARPRVTLATFPAGAPRDEVMPAGARPGRWSPYAFTLASGDPAPLINAGTAAVQDEGSQLAAIALAGVPLAGQPDGASERWLDLCAGPGGKARLLYGLAAVQGANLTAAELHPHRAALVEAALTRAAESIAAAPPFEVMVADSTTAPWPDGSFDRVLADVPCTGLGALRRRPEARWRKSPADLDGLAALQRDLLRSALAAVRPGGVVGYVTCSPVPAETTEVVAAVTASVPGAEVLDAPALLPSVPAAAAADPRFVQLWPHRQGTDAIFIALLRRTG